MPYLVILVLCLLAFGCSRESEPELSRRTPPPLAIALNDSAIALAFTNVGDTSLPNDVIGLLDRAIAIDSSYRPAYWNRASQLDAYDRRAETIESLDEWLEEHPNDHLFRVVRAQLAGDRAELSRIAKKMLAVADSMIEVHPDSVDLLLDRTYWLYVSGERDRALSDLGSLESRYPESETVQMVAQVTKDSVSFERFLIGQWR